MALPAFRFAGCKDGASPEVRHYTVPAGQTFLAGDPVKLNATNDEVIACTDDDTTILGIACASAAYALALTVKTIPVIHANPNTIFSAALKNSWSADHLGNDVSLDLATSTFTVDNGTAGNALGGYIGLDPTDSGRALVYFKAAKAQIPSGDVAAI